MTRPEHLLVILMEECAEVAQRASKALRFGLGEVQPGMPFPHSNAARLVHELSDLYAAVEMLQSEGVFDVCPIRSLVVEKKLKVEEFLRYSAECGTLTAETRP